MPRLRIGRIPQQPHFDIISWLGAYRAATPGVRGGDNGTLRLDLKNRPHPMLILELFPKVAANPGSTMTAMWQELRSW